MPKFSTIEPVVFFGMGGGGCRVPASFTKLTSPGESSRFLFYFIFFLFFSEDHSYCWKIINVLLSPCIAIAGDLGIYKSKIAKITR